MLTFRATDCIILRFSWPPTVCPKNQIAVQRIVLRCSRRPFAPHIHAVHLETNTKASRISSATTEHSVHLDTGGHFLDFTEDTSSSDFQHCTSQPNHNCFLYLREHFSRRTNTHFYSRETARHPDKHLITHHLALITSYRNDTANEDILPVVRQYTLKDSGLSVRVVTAPTPLRLSPVVSHGSRTRHTSPSPHC